MICYQIKLLGTDMDKCDLDNAAHTLRSQCIKVVKVARREFLEDLDKAGVKLAPGQYKVLRCLYGKDLALTDLSRQLGLDPSTLVPLVESLVSKGLVERSRDPIDRRRTPLRITARGAVLLDKGSSCDENGTLVEALCKLGDEKTRQLVSLLSEFVSNFPDSSLRSETDGGLSLLEPSN
jgi:DNA-binding MarR family transcriptional regulator